MFCKKKHTESKIVAPSPTRKKHQKHSRKPTKDKSVQYTKPELLAKYQKSARVNSDMAILQKINAIFVQSTTAAC